MGSVYRPRDRRTWWIKYSVNGRVYTESAHSHRKQDAVALVRLREGDAAKGLPVSPRLGRVTLGEALQAVVDDQVANGRATADRTAQRIRAHVLRHWRAEWRLTALTGATLAAYTRARLAEGAKPATVNRELAIVRRAFRLALRHGLITTAPAVPLLAEQNTRRGFVSREQFEAIRAQLPSPVLRDVVTMAYLTGWRTQSEILPLQWSQVDRTTQTIRLGRTKNDEGRTFPYGALRELVEVIERRWAEHERVTSTGRIVPYVFTRPDGQRLRSIRKAWRRACHEAGLPGRLLHDLRRSAARNFLLAGISEPIAMRLLGHATASMFRRYAITALEDLRAALQRLEPPAGTRAQES